MANELPLDETTPRDPEDRPVPPRDQHAIREKNLDKTLADSFPTSDPPSTIPDPASAED
ncbi:MAG TPA: hypothetical protein VHU44_13510 [Acidobacteriaceae bacterium]|nr:hypothetical protein [Acidobacteriaceae bacterium]